MNTADILEEAAAIMDRRGLCRGAYESADGSVCTLGAMRYAIFGQIDVDGARHLWNTYIDVYDYLCRHIAVGSVGDWSDAQERTTEEVVSTLRSAAQAARAEQ